VSRAFSPLLITEQFLTLEVPSLALRTTACGDTGIDSANDKVVGLSSDLFGDGSLCGASITVTGPNGVSSTGTIVDSGADVINLSEAMFTEIEGSLDAGVFQGTYELNNQNEKRAKNVRVQYTEFNGQVSFRVSFREERVRVGD